MEPNFPIIDLHMHSTFSDGTDSPAELLAHVREAGIGIFSLTDHDAIAGCEVLRSLLTPGDPRFLPGVEFSCRDELGKYHILGYAYDPGAPSIQAVVNLGHSYRMKKLDARLDFLRAEFGFDIPAEEREALHDQPNPGKPHIGNLMTKLGYTESKEQAIVQYLNRLHLPSEYIRPEEAIAGILGAGGIPVLAHPFFGDGDQLILGQELKDRVLRLMDFGLQGLEAYYSGFTAPLRLQALALAEQYALYVTAGSDYHGTNKLMRPGETGMPRKSAPPAGLLRFLEAASI